MAAMMPPETKNTTGRMSTMTTAMISGPSTASLLPLEGPRLHFHQRADGQRLHRDRGTGRPVVAECGDVGLVHGRVIVHVGEEHGRLCHIAEAGAVLLQEVLHVVERLLELGLEAVGQDR